MLTRLFAETMKQQGGGYISASFFVRGACADSAIRVYSGAKAHVIAFTQALAARTAKGQCSFERGGAGFHADGVSRCVESQTNAVDETDDGAGAMDCQRAVEGMFKGKLLITPGAFIK